MLYQLSLDIRYLWKEIFFHVRFSYNFCELLMQKEQCFLLPCTADGSRIVCVKRKTVKMYFKKTCNHFQNSQKCFYLMKYSTSIHIC